MELLGQIITIGLVIYLFIDVYLLYNVSGICQSDSDIYQYLFRFFSIILYYKILNIVPCAIQ